MRRTVHLGAALVMMAALLAGCGDSATMKKLRADNLTLKENLEQCQNDRVRLSEEKGSLQGQLDALKGDLGICRNQNASLKEQVAFLKAEVGKAPKDAGALPPMLQDALEQFAKQHGDIVSLVGERVCFKSDIIFQPGKADVSVKGLSTLKEFAAIFQKEGMDLYLRIDGHTDIDPIKVTKKKYRDNWDLGYERSYQVAKILFEAGTPEEKVVLASQSKFTPIDPETTKEAKAKNRRVEILLLPTK